MGGSRGTGAARPPKRAWQAGAPGRGGRIERGGKTCGEKDRNIGPSSGGRAGKRLWSRTRHCLTRPLDKSRGGRPQKQGDAQPALPETLSGGNW